MANFLVESNTPVASEFGNFKPGSIVELNPELAWVKSWVKDGLLRLVGSNDQPVPQEEPTHQFEPNQGEEESTPSFVPPTEEGKKSNKKG